jgi:5-methylcytosine-specific restriction enzyme subunit McrC
LILPEIICNAKALNNSNLDLLPKMQTDITLISQTRKIILDTKFYTDTLAQYYETEKFHSANSYQLFSYLKNLESDFSHPFNLVCEGILLYPTIEKEIDERFQIDSHIIRVVTVDLNTSWPTIAKKLLAILQ